MAASAQAGVAVPIFQPEETRHRRNISGWAQWINQGHLQNTGSVTLGTGTVATVVSDTRVSINSVPILQPSTLPAASATAVYVSTVSAGGFTITHTSSGSADRAFRYALLG